ncbi:pentapeptide repeat-containing protein [Xanthobacter variabilis]|uniref:pentapeptide repeat-containing protein n=1 Tax=Xanthobacter variabilis TaxID=3119932 RepID=UPI00374F218E
MQEIHADDQAEKRMRLIQILAGLLSAAGAVAAAIGVWLQFAAYREEGFVRQYGAFSLAWTIVKDGNGIDHDIGQGAALQFLFDQGQLYGDISLVNSLILSVILGSADREARLSSSTFCGTHFLFVSMINANIRQSNFTNAHMSTVFLHGVHAYGSHFDNVYFMKTYADDASFVAASFVRAVVHGGSFKGADFSGADLKGLLTMPLLGSSKKGGGAPAFDRPFDQNISNAEALSAIELDLPLAPADAIETPVDFTEAKFDHADIRGADLRSSNITQRQVDVACADETTQLPDGVRPKAACGGEEWVVSRRAFLQETGGRRADLPACSTPARPE